ncbi:hypothetical protein F0562_030901 [Nyssa sinensis]|uniref:CBM20 domain-containing protein n=1 Tax=Nyssa sinensis TaxID=561372 RepID=A0A5J5B036_9ASTE|nr:hypothetical protein F0562_030901 [Nyssa sinensis]
MQPKGVLHAKVEANRWQCHRLQGFVDRSTSLYRHSSRIFCGVSSSGTRKKNKKDKKKKKKKRLRPGSSKVRLHVQLDHQVEYGGHVAILGSTKEFGSWKKKVAMDWTNNGWVCEVELKGGESIKYKFLIGRKDKSVVWESGDNRVLKLPE